MDAKEKKETINRVMHLLRCGKISSATPNKDVWKFFEFEENNGWISVDDQLPPYNEKVLVFYGVDRYIGLAMLEDVVGLQTFWSDGRKAVFHITHWRHLPAPPKKKNGQGWVPASSGRPA